MRLLATLISMLLLAALALTTEAPALAAPPPPVTVQVGDIKATVSGEVVTEVDANGKITKKVGSENTRKLRDAVVEALKTQAAKEHFNTLKGLTTGYTQAPVENKVLFFNRFEDIRRFVIGKKGLAFWNENSTHLDSSPGFTFEFGQGCVFTIYPVPKVQAFIAGGVQPLLFLHEFIHVIVLACFRNNIDGNVPTGYVLNGHGAPFLLANLVQAARATAEIILNRCIAGERPNGAHLIAGVITQSGLPDVAQQRYVQELWDAFKALLGRTTIVANQRKLQAFMEQFKAAANRKWPGLLR